MIAAARFAPRVGRPRSWARVLSGALIASALACGAQDAPEVGAPVAAVTAAGTGPDVWLADVHWLGAGSAHVTDPVNLTQRPGYDNQPSFVPDGSGLWYTAVDEHDGQADIWRYDFATGSVARVTSSNPESEYSATPLPDGSGISVIRVEADSTQRLWRFDADGANPRVVLASVAPVGYHAWADERTLILFVLGDPPTLQRARSDDGAASIVASNIGRSIQRIPGSNDVSFVQRSGDGTSTIMRLRPGSAEPEALVPAVDGGDFHAWAPNGTLVMAGGSVLYWWTPPLLGAPAATPEGWQTLADFSHLRLTITRLAFSPDGARLALVAEVGL